LLPAADASPVLPLRLCDPRGLAAEAVRARAAGRDRQPRFPHAPRNGGAGRPAARTAGDDPAPGMATLSENVAIVGAGVFGAWTAHHLQQGGHKVTLIDAWGPAHSRASSGGESRMTR